MWVVGLAVVLGGITLGVTIVLAVVGACVMATVGMIKLLALLVMGM